MGTDWTPMPDSYRDDLKERIINSPSKPKRVGVEVLPSSVRRRRSGSEVVENGTVRKEDYARQIRDKLNTPVTQGAQVNREEQIKKLEAFFKK